MSDSSVSMGASTKANRMKKRRSCPDLFAWAMVLHFLAGPVAAATENAFTISIDERAWSTWGFQYPVTYIFKVGAIGPEAQVLRRDSQTGAWRPLAQVKAGEFFNGVQCARLEPDAKKVYVSVGFHGCNRIDLKLANMGTVEFESIAPYYDRRTAAYTLSIDDWGEQPDANVGAPWQGMTSDASDKFQAALHVCRTHRLPVSIAVVSRLRGGASMWQRMQEELDDPVGPSWEPAAHTRSHACSQKEYRSHGYTWEVRGCKEDILKNLQRIPYGPYVFEFILSGGYRDELVEKAASGEFLLARGWNPIDNPASTTYAAWNRDAQFFGVGGLQTASYDTVLGARNPKGRYYAEDVAALNRAVDRVYHDGGIFYAMWHPDRYRNSIAYDPSPGVDGLRGSTLMQHLAHVAKRPDVWYVANGWLYSYRFVAEHAQVSRARER